MAEQDIPPDRARRPGFALISSLIVGLAVFAAVVAFNLARAPKFDIEIPRGASSGIESGGIQSADKFLQSPVRVKAGTVVTVANHDDRFHILGPITVQPGDTKTFTLSTSGTFDLVTTLRAPQVVRFIVR